MSRITLRAQNCKSCGYCVRTCRQGALSISDQVNEAGYHVVAADEDRCVGCGLCYTVCPDFVFDIADEGR